MSLAPGARLGAYEITALIGAGGMGEVYKARDTRLNRTVAIKVLPAQFTSEPQFGERFDREAKAISQLNHPNICTLHDIGNADGLDYLVMEYLEGETLAHRLLKGIVPLDQALQIAVQIADALDKAHRRGIVHRDLKPGNIMLTKSGAKLLDFGLAKTGRAPFTGRSLSALPTTPAITAQGTVLGTVQYMAPEQLEGNEADARTDIWALGVVIYEMVTGARPFNGDSAASLIGSILKDQPALMSERGASTLPLLDQVVVRCLAKDAWDRWQSAADLRQALLWIGDRSLSKLAEARHVESRRVGRGISAVGRIIPWVLIPLLVAALLISRRGSTLQNHSDANVARFELNYPPGVEMATTSGPSLGISPDGTLLAFVGGVSGLRAIYVRRLNEFSATRIRGTEGVNLCLFSPDARELAFVTSGRVLKKVSLSDGLVTTITAPADYVAGAAWGSDDRMTFTRDGTIWQISPSGGEARQLTTLDPARNERLHGWPSAVPGGKAVLFTSVTGGDRNRMQIEAVAVATGKRHVVVDSASFPTYTLSGHLIFFRNGALLAAPFDVKTLQTTGQAVAVLDDISVDRLGNPIMATSAAGLFAYVPRANATRRLVWVSRQGVEQTITETSRPYDNPRLAPDGQRIVVEVAGGNLWMQDLARMTFTRLTSGETFGNTWAVWRPTANRIVFRTLTGTRWLDPDGSRGSHEIPGTSVNDLPTSISPDGRTLAFVRQTEQTGGGDIYTMSLDRDSAPSALVETAAYDGGGQFSPDGRWMAYVSGESGAFEVYVRPFPGPDRKKMVSTEGGTHPRWNPNGRELFYRSGDRMMVVDVSMGSDVKLSRPRVLFEQRYVFGSAQTIPNYDVTPDGERFLMVKDDAASGRLNVVLNWLQELKRLAPTAAP